MPKGIDLAFGEFENLGIWDWVRDFKFWVLTI
jgi:hypothetical protein